MSIQSSFDNKWEKNIYGQRKQLNRYPFSDVVSYVMRLFGERLKAKETLRALEVGFGGGNNIIFLAQVGFETYGIEGSHSACKFAMEQVKKNGLNAKLMVGDFVKLPYSDNFFDLVLDREAIYCNVPSAISQTIGEVYRVLKRSGLFLSFMYSLEHGSRLSDGGRIVDTNTYTDFEKGSLAGTGVTHFFSKEEILNQYLKDFEIEFMRHLRVDEMVPSEQNVYAEFHTCARKR